MPTMETVTTMYLAPTKREYVGHFEHPQPEWSKRQREAWAAARSISGAMLELGELHRAGIIPSYEPSTRAYLAWMELEREIAPLFAEFASGEQEGTPR